MPGRIGDDSSGRKHSRPRAIHRGPNRYSTRVRLEVLVTTKIEGRRDRDRCRRRRRAGRRKSCRRRRDRAGSLFTENRRLCRFSIRHVKVLRMATTLTACERVRGFVTRRTHRTRGARRSRRQISSRGRGSRRRLSNNRARRSQATRLVRRRSSHCRSRWRGR